MALRAYRDRRLSDRRMLGYAIGAVLYNTLGQWLINLYGYGAKMDALKQTYAQWGWLVILVKGVTPIPL